MLRGIRIGELDRRIEIKSLSTSRDSETNAQTVTYSTLDTVWAKRLKDASREGDEEKQLVAVRTVRYLIRYRSDVNEQMIFIDNSKTYQITNIEEIDRKGALILTGEYRDNG